MNFCFLLSFILFPLLPQDTSASEEAKVIVEVNRGEPETSEFRFQSVPVPSSSDAGNRASAKLLTGRIDRNGADVEALFDGGVAQRQDDPPRSFFLSGRTGGRLLIDLTQPRELQQINTYSWHPRARGPQVYSLYAATEQAQGLELEPGASTNPIDVGWTLIAEVDTRQDGEPTGGQYGVSVQGADGKPLGRYRYLLMELSVTDEDERFNQTFYSEIDIVDGNEYARPERVAHVETLSIGDKYEIVFDTTEVPEIRDWVEQKLKPACREWYPKIVELLPSEGYTAPARFTIVFHRDMSGVANASGQQINCAGPWFLRNLNGEAPGAVVHEMVHIVQQYRGRRGRSRNPGWMVEGVADYIRWFMYEPLDQRPRPNPRRSNYDDSYRTTAAFLNYVVANHDPELVTKFNAAMREGRYSDELWTEYTGKTPAELWEEFTESLEREDNSD